MQFSLINGYNKLNVIKIKQKEFEQKLSEKKQNEAERYENFECFSLRSAASIPE